jgi:hypothetical protein
LAKDGPAGDSSHVSTRVMGTYGYAAPEYMATGTEFYKVFTIPLFCSTVMFLSHMMYIIMFLPKNFVVHRDFVKITINSNMHLVSRN